MENMYKMLEKDHNLLWVCINQIIISLKPISIHQNILIKYATILAYYPMKESKMEIFIKLDKKQKVGMLSRHIMGVASKLGIYQTLLKEIINLKQSHRTARKYIKPKPKKIIVNHGDPQRSVEFSKAVAQRFGISSTAIRNLDALRLR